MTTMRPALLERLPTHWLLLAVSSATILVALGFEHLGGYRPCPLCLQERYAYYGAIAVLAVCVGLRWPAGSGRLRAALGLVALGYLINTGLGIYHSGVEWGWWQGPTSCASGGAATGGGSLLDDLRRSTLVRCDAAPWRLLGLSFAGWNAVISAGLAALATLGAWRPAGGADGN